MECNEQPNFVSFYFQRVGRNLPAAGGGRHGPFPEARLEMCLHLRAELLQEVIYASKKNVYRPDVQGVPCFLLPDKLKKPRGEGFWYSLLYLNKL